MNQLVEHYCADVKHPEVSGAEHLEMLQIRDRLAEIKSTLTPEEKDALAEADRALVEQATVFYEELLRFVDLVAHRQEHGIPPARWWWYLDVVSHVPRFEGGRQDVSPSTSRQPSGAVRE
jgi:hypothetical protein